MPQNTDNTAGMSVLGQKRKPGGTALAPGVAVRQRAKSVALAFPTTDGGEEEVSVGVAAKYAGMMSPEHVAALSTLAECFEAWFGCPPDAYAVRVYREWNAASPGSTVGKFKDDKALRYFPRVDWSKVGNFRDMFSGCSALESVAGPINAPVSCDAFTMFADCVKLAEVPDISMPKMYNCGWMCLGCTSLTRVGTLDTAGSGVMCNMFEGCSSLESVAGLDTSSATNLERLFTGCRKLTEVPELDVSKATTVMDMFCDCVFLRKVRLKGFGTVTENADGVFKNATLLGHGGGENRQSLVDTLLTDSFDRAAAGMPVLTLRYFPAAVKNRLTSEERAAIEAKGYKFA